jgi:tRNA A37 threonylcarbamoyladenosine dehydratase
MDKRFIREEILVGKEAINKLAKSKVLVFGVGGVGSYVCEALARAGVGKFVIVDNDTVDISNINRQLIATSSTIGKNKVDVMRERILDINPKAKVDTYCTFFSHETKEHIIKKPLTYVIDCIDSVPSKIEIIKQCKNLDIPVISSMGTGNKLFPNKFEIKDINQTSVCPLARSVRKQLKAEGIDHVKVLFSKEEPIKNDVYINENRKIVPGSVSFVPSVAGLMIAGEVVRDILDINR